MIWLAILLAASAPEDLWIASSGSGACDSSSLASALLVLRPGLRPHTDPAPESSRRLTLSLAAGVWTLELHSPQGAITRTFPDQGDCETALRTAALIVDGALDDLSAPAETPRIEALTTKPPVALELSLSIGVGVEQGLLGAAGTTGLEVEVRRGPFLASVGGEIVYPSSKTITTGNGPATYSARGGDVEGTVGFTPRLGPGRLLASVAVGVALTSAEIETASIFQRLPATVPELFLGLRVSYRLDLPARFFVTALLEERVAPSQAFFYIDGDGSLGMTRMWTLAGTIGAGRHFF